MSEFQVQRTQFSTGRIIPTPAVEDLALSEGEIIVKVDRFAYTANNITYAVAGDMIGYWQFFPPSGGDSDGWGIIPVWGFADVVASKADAIPVGDRLFGYFPPATHLKLLPTAISDQRFIDGSAHRSKLPAGYNLYRRVNGEGHYDQRFDNQRMVLFPLHLTAFCIWDALQDKSWHGAEQVLILSASSKTSIGLAIALDEDENAPTIIGVTSEKNKGKVDETGLYAEIYAYDEIDKIDSNKKTVIVDMSGNIKVLNALNASLGENLAYCIQVGLTHWHHAGQKMEIAKEKSEFFFAPGHIQKRIKEWGSAKFEQTSSQFLVRSAQKIGNWLSYETINGLDGLSAIHEDVCHGNISPDKGLIVEMP